jgi:RNA polymerase sigma-70 factor (ECF subfamily)
VAYRLLGSSTEAEDAVQEAWLRLSRAGTDGVENLGGWLTTVVARVSLDLLRQRKSRREDAGDEGSGTATPAPVADPLAEAELGDAVGMAMLVVLEKLTPAERVAFVLHDLFDVPFDEIATILGRTGEATRQLASRARRRVALVDEAVGLVWMHQGELKVVFAFTLEGGKVRDIELVAEPERLAGLHVRVLEG